MLTEPIEAWLTLGHQSGREALTAPKGMSLLAALMATLPALLNSPLPAAQVAQSDTTSPVFELRKGERHFRIEGAPAFVLGRNPVGVSPEAFAEHFQKAAAAGERFMRIHFVDTTSGRVMKTRTVEAKKHQLKIPLPTFKGSIALRLTASIEKRGARVERRFAP